MQMKPDEHSIATEFLQIEASSVSEYHLFEDCHNLTWEVWGVSTQMAQLGGREPARAERAEKSKWIQTRRRRGELYYYKT